MAGLKRAGLLLGAVALAPCLALMAQGLIAPPAHGRGPAQPDAYLRLLNSVFVRNNWLVANPDGKPAVELSPAAKQSPEAMAFYEGSPLHRDLARDDAGLWRIVNGVVVEMTPFAHYQPQPFSKAAAWRGGVYFRSDREAASRVEIASGDGAFHLAQRTAGAAPKVVHADPFAGALSGEGDTLELAAGAGAGPDPAPLVRIVLAGDTPLVRVIGRSGSAMLDGRQLRLGETGALAAGSELVLKRGRRTASITARGASAEAVSVRQPLADRYRAPGLERVARHVEAAMNEAVARGVSPERDLRLSLDRRLQGELQRALDAWCRDHGRFRAAVTVMDAETGEILALASYPGEGDETGAGQDRGDLARNQNFFRMPIGSAAKVPISAAILAEHPELRSLEVHGQPGDDEITDLMGVEFAPIQDEATGLAGWIGFDDFLKYSSNRYATGLMVLGSARRPEDGQGPTTGDDPFRLGGQARSRLPALPFAETPGDHGVKLGELENKLTWPGKLHDLFDIDYEAPRAGARLDEFGDDSSDMRLWRGLLCDPALTAGGRAPVLAELRDVSPDREVFATNKISTFRADYAPMILGGQAWGWTNVKLAQSFARIVTGKPIEATLLQGPARACGPAPMQAVPPEVRQTLMHAMAKVVEDGGTARALQPGLAELRSLAPAGESIGLWGKTGTPSLETARLTTREQAENALIRARVLQLKDGEVVVVGQSRTIAAEERGARAALAANPAARAVMARFRVRPETVLARAVRYNREHTAGLYDIKNGVLTEVKGAGGLVKQHDPKIFAFVVGRYRGAPGEGEPRRALAVAINIEERWLPTNESVMFARCMLPTALAPVLYEDAARTRPLPAECKRLGLS